MSKNSGNGGRNDKFVRVKTAKGRTNSSAKWLKRQLNDPYVRQAQKDGYRSRAVYKLLEIDEKYKIIKPNSVVVDLGAAPGSWSQAALKILKAERGGKIVGIDLQEIDSLAGAEFLQGDFLEEDVYLQLKDLVCSGAGDSEKGFVDVVMSDMAAAACGHTQTDHIRIMYLCEVALDFAFEVLKKDGVFLAKILRGGAENELQKAMKKYFSSVKYIKPQASRADSSEMYVVAVGFSGDRPRRRE